MKYFEWKEKYEFYYQNPYCTMCQKLHNKYEPVKTYQNMTDWYYNKQCTDGSEREYYKTFMRNY